MYWQALDLTEERPGLNKEEKDLRRSQASIPKSVLSTNTSSPKLHAHLRTFCDHALVFWSVFVNSHKLETLGKKAQFEDLFQLDWLLEYRWDIALIIN